MSLTKRIRQRGWIPAVALVFAWLLLQLPAVERLDHIVSDVEQGLVAREIFFEDAVVLDIDEASLRKLEPTFGNWPYGRDTYALMLDYLNEQGAAAVVFDIMFAENRAFDKEFAEALKRNGNGVLVAVTPTGDESMSPADAARLKALSWQVPTGLARPTRPALLLPNATLTEGAPATSVGVVTAHSDVDGVLRRLPLVHEVEGSVLPTLPLAALQPQALKRTLVPQGNGWAVGEMRWETDNTGQVALYLPKNANAVLSMPFHEAAEAALGAVALKDAATFFRGKTVFIGSTAYLSDRVITPRGPMSGTYALATAQQTLHSGLYWRPPLAPLNAGLLALSVAALLGLILVPWRNWLSGTLWLAGATAVIAGVHLAILAWLMQPSTLLFSLLTLVLGWGIHMLWEQATLQRRTRQLEHDADMDSLTGLPVRRAFFRAFEREIASAKRHSRPLSVGILDLDHFKRVNDNYGHPVGDLVLKTFAGVLKKSMRASDSICRWGGEEFVVLLPDTDCDAAKGVLDKLRLAIAAESFPPPAADLKVTMSAGLAQYDGQMSPDDAVGEADKALYEAKETGRNRICISRA